MVNFRKLLGGNTLLYRGCMLRGNYEELSDNYEELLRKGGVKFVVLENELCCGSPIRNAGEDWKEQARKVNEWLKEHGIVKIVTPCPACFHTFRTLYREALPDWDVEVVHASQVLAELVKKGKLKARAEKDVMVFHDPCHLGRAEGVYDEPRQIVRAAGKLEEMEFGKELSQCCGGGGGMPNNQPELARKMAKKRIKEAGGRCVITACPMCYHMLKGQGKTRELSQLFE
ncbi:MAG TPA: (Fe-S)-binding protein [archaeon]|nr:(Fe-S)-binding protein [archaeon]